MSNLARQATPLDKYVYLRTILSWNQELFYFALTRYVDQLMPIVYTPTVGEACVRYSDILLPPGPSGGLFLPHTAAASFDQILQNWPHPDVRVIVVTDGERILGLGDLGANGMGIPVGKLSLYAACAGIHPRYTLPITLDMGTNNKKLLDNSAYIGLRTPRITGDAFDAVLESFVSAVTRRWPKVLIQWEDFGNTNAFRLLDRYRRSVCSFNDDIQGTACVALAGLLAAAKLSKKSLAEQTFLFLGAGEAGTGIGDLIAYYLVQSNTVASVEEAHKRIFYVDSQGLVCKSRTNLAHHKLPYAHDVPFLNTFEEAVATLKPSAIIGVCTQPQTFTKPIIEMMASFNERPVIFALSNPTSKSECTAEQAYTWSGGRAIFASGSPFDPVVYNGKTFHPGQGNNAYVFPGIGLGVIASEASVVPEEMFLTAADTLANLVTDAHLNEGLVYPPLSEIRKVSMAIGVAVATQAFDLKIARAAKPASIDALVRSYFYEPAYTPFLQSSL